MAKYVVAGVTGRVGSAVAEELLARGQRPTVIVRDVVGNDARAAQWSARGAEVAVGSLDDRAFVARTIQGADGFFTLLPENVAPDDFCGARMRMADAIADAVAESDIRHVVMLSSLPAVLAEGNGPAKPLHHMENRLRKAAPVLTTLRACYLQQNIAGVLPAARYAGIYPNLLASADLPMPMIANADVARFAADALMNPPAASEIVDLFGPPYTIRELAEKLSAVVGRRVQVVDIPAAGQVAALTEAGVPRPIAEAVAEMFAAINAGLVVPSGDRRRTGTTTIDALVDRLVRDSQPAVSPGELTGP